MDYLMRMNYKMRRRRRRRICTYSKMETEKRLNQLLQNPKD